VVVLDQELQAALGMPVDLVTEDSLDQKLRTIIQKDIEVIYDKAG
jgi:predicted nucleotidyltransferase